jgi:bile acid:Na+ symporter, BASS family
MGRAGESHSTARLKTFIDIGILLVTILMMVSVGMEMEVHVARKGWALWILFFAQALTLPILALMLTRWMPMSAHLGAGILLVAACPVGDIANVYAMLARANVALSLTLNVLTCLGTMLTMTGTFAIYEWLLPGRFDLAAPAPVIVLRMFMMVLVPVLAGMFIRTCLPGFVARHRRALHRATILGILLLVGYVAASRWDQLVAEWRQAAVAGALFVTLALAAGLLIGVLLQFGRKDVLTAGIVFAVRNVGIASAVAITTLGRLEYAVFALVYFLAEIPILLGFSLMHRWRSEPDTERE